MTGGSSPGLVNRWEYYLRRGHSSKCYRCRAAAASWCMKLCCFCIAGRFALCRAIQQAKSFLSPCRNRVVALGSLGYRCRSKEEIFFDGPNTSVEGCCFLKGSRKRSNDSLSLLLRRMICDSLIRELLARLYGDLSPLWRCFFWGGKGKGCDNERIDGNVKKKCMRG